MLASVKAKTHEMPVAWAKAVADFQAHLSDSRSAGTAGMYAIGVRMFFAWLGARPFTEALPSNSLQEFALSGLRGGKSPATLRVYVAGVRKFCAWLAQSGLKAPVLGAVEWPRHSMPPPAALSSAELGMFLAWVRANAVEPYRTAMLMAPYCGLRISELVSLKLSDVSIAGGGIILKVFGKGAKWREVPVIDQFRPTLAAYLSGWRDDTKGLRCSSRWLFPSATKPSIALDRRSLTQRFTEAGRALNVDLTAHTMRRQYATSLHKSGVALATISKALGHSEPRTTSERYLAMTGADMVAATRKVRL